ncbi:MAG: hypothetical protein ACYTAS_13625 [Planctomycetota bacterium]|jgi:hypothetical protein
MPIRLPKERTYYSASPGEPDRLTVWIPTAEYEKVAGGKEAAKKLAKDFPLGLEVEVGEADLKEAGVSLGLTPKELKAAHGQIRRERDGARHARVAGQALEARAREMTEDGSSGHRRGARGPASTGPRREREEPTMSDGDEPIKVFHRLSKGRRRDAR